MQSYRLSSSGAGLAGLRSTREEVPSPGPGEVLVAVRAAALNHRDQLVLDGDYVLPVRADGIPLAEGVGVVAEVGPGAGSGPAVGSRVVPAVFPRWRDGPFALDVADQLGGSLDGMLAEYRVLPGDALVEVPGFLTDAEAASLACAGVTAWNALTGGRGVRAGETVLTLGTGGVSLWAVQLAAAMGAKVVATTGDDAKAELLTRLGAAVVVNYRTAPDWPAAVREATGGRGADHVVEVAGTLAASVAATAFGGQVDVVGFMGTPAPVDPSALFTGGVTLRPVALGSRSHLVGLVRAVATHRLRPVVDRVFPFDRAPEAFAHHRAGGAVGKVVVSVATTGGR
ncbi:zinc-dependent alcohol dehydrogenase family protein [Pseudonocardia humida]|uniref:NAD(P)-dependent alcohol dehydrogenase n=1 Tax=Pseudonocardia humida TaxID=2800819 RepID=A0ABT1A4P3_9PSEU|nr:NAD(P)-dependent alcohol dehydrogenase [Pseudonocardia humida]MCO1657976.1 NAD(P)-dependent alcohol dehydrogenase [Pseudonocardia humida]